MATGKKDTTGARSDKPLDWAAFYERVKLARQLVQLGKSQLKQAETDFGLALAGLAEIEAELAARGIGGAE